MSSHSTTKRTRAPRSDGIRTRQAILDEAARLATVEGLEGLSLARLAEQVGMSKSGLFAHFGSKEELQIATVEQATAIFDEHVMRPAADEADGLARLRGLLERFLRHVEVAVFPGGCFFASAVAELDTRSGPVRELVVSVADGWSDALEQAARDAQEEGLLDARVDPAQLAFELDAYAMLGNALFVASGSKEALDRARRAIAERLEGVLAPAPSSRGVRSARRPREGPARPLRPA